MVQFGFAPNFQILGARWNESQRFSPKELGHYFKAQWGQGKDSINCIRFWSKPSANSSFSSLLQVVHHSHKHLLKPEQCSWHSKATRCHIHPQCFQGTHFVPAASTDFPREERIPWFAALLNNIAMCSLQTLKCRRAVCRLGQMLISMCCISAHTQPWRGESGVQS